MEEKIYQINHTKDISQRWCRLVWAHLWCFFIPFPSLSMVFRFFFYYYYTIYLHSSVCMLLLILFFSCSTCVFTNLVNNAQIFPYFLCYFFYQSGCEAHTHVAIYLDEKQQHALHCYDLRILTAFPIHSNDMFFSLFSPILCVLVVCVFVVCDSKCDAFFSIIFKLYIRQ